MKASEELKSQQEDKDAKIRFKVEQLKDEWLNTYSVRGRMNFIKEHEEIAIAIEELLEEVKK